MYCCKKRVKLKVLAGTLAMLLCAAPALGQTTAEKVRAINEEIALLNAKLQKLDLEAKIATKETERQRLDQLSVSGNQATEQQNTVEMPVVKAIEGIDGKLVAKLAMRGGMEQTVSIGEKFGAWTTKEISVNSVTFARGKETVRVPFGNQPPSEYQGGQRGNAASAFPATGAYPVAQPPSSIAPNF